MYGCMGSDGCGERELSRQKANYILTMGAMGTPGHVRDLRFPMTTGRSYSRKAEADVRGMQGNKRREHH